MNELYVVNNTINNDRPTGARFIFVAPGTQRVQILNNIFTGPGTLLVGPGQPAHNIRGANPGFVDPDVGVVWRAVHRENHQFHVIREMYSYHAARCLYWLGSTGLGPFGVQC